MARVFVPEWQQSMIVVKLTPAGSVSNAVLNQSSRNGLSQFRSVGHRISSRPSASSLFLASSGTFDPWPE